MDLTQLKNSRSARRPILNKLFNDLEQAILVRDKQQVELILEKIKIKEMALLGVNEQLEVASPVDEVAVEVANNDAFNDFIIEAKVKANRFLRSSPPGTGSVAVGVAASATATKIVAKLPKLQIPKFDGILSDWERFWSQFSAGVHENAALSKVDKFNYLLSLLTEKARIAIKGFSLTEANYDVAVKILVEKFGQPEVLVSEHVQQLWSIRKVTQVGNGAELRCLYEEFLTHIHSLENLGKNISSMGTLLCHILLQALPKPILIDWNRKNAGNGNDDLTALLEFVKKEIESVEVASRMIATAKETVAKKDSRFSVPSSTTTSALLATEGSASNSSSTTVDRKSFKPYCVFCNEENTHTSANCRKYVSNQDRKSALFAAHRCFRCTKKGNHLARNCNERIVCRGCKQSNHHTWLCPQRSTPQAVLATTSNRMEADRSRHSNDGKAEVAQTALIASSAAASSKGSKNVSVLQTLRVWIKHAGGMEEVVALVDGGSERSFVSSRIVQQLNLKHSGEESTLIRSFGGCQKQQKSLVIPLTLQGSNGMQLKLSALQVPEICHGVKFWEAGLIERFLQDKRTYSWSQKMGPGELVDIDILIGADHYWKVMTGHMKRLSSTLMATQSVFGWMMLGGTPMHSPFNSTVAMCIATESAEATTLNNKLATMWELDRTGIMAKEDATQLTLQEVEVMQRFKETTIFQDGRYQVRIPWNNHKSELASNFNIALERLRRLLWKLQKDPVLFQRYKSAIFEYVQNNHAEEVEFSRNEFPVYYMPHHAIIRDDRKTTKTRIVFDASSSSEGGLSLNSCQDAGPNLNPTIFDLLLRFRWHRIGMTTDISKAFLQIYIHPADRDATRYLWTDKPWARGTQPQLQVYRMNRVLFGMKASPFLLAATIRHHASTHPDSDATLSQHLSERTYVDDCLTGSETTQEAHELSTRIRTLMEKGGMQFTKWATNDAELRKLWVKEGIVTEEEPIELLKVLGLLWDPLTDTLSIKSTAIMQAIKSDPCTKRSVLEILARVFDPLGVLAPITVIAKCLLQDLWKLKIDWDGLIPDNLLPIWTQWKDELVVLQEVRIARWLQSSNSEGLQLHVFCDAGPRVYAAVAYIRYQLANKQEFQVCLVTAKSRLAPLQPMSIPRLELMACLIGSRLAVSVSQALKLEGITGFLWSDSKVALKWIEDVPSRWKLFVARRVQEIQANTATGFSWNYCSSKRNIADIITRGQQLKKLSKNQEWWNGPQWLSEPEEEWKTASLSLQDEETSELQLEEQAICTNVQVNVCAQPLLQAESFSSWQKLIRITAWIIRFCSKCRKKSAVESTWLTFPEIQAAERYWILTLQQQQFCSELQALSQKKELPKESSILQFNPFLDKDGLIRLGGRLQFAEFPEEQKHPFLLKGGGLVELLIRDRHIKMMHGGVQITLSQLRKDVWIIRGRQVVRKALHGCMRCRRWNAKPAGEVEAPLPVERISQSSPFHSTGLDFAGPIHIKVQEQPVKAYVCLFTCAVTRAVHLELVASQHVSHFILAFRRFVARRGGCKIVFSDNSKTFQKVDRLLRESYEWLRSTQTQEVAAELAIEWKFIAPRAAWWGGFYERMVQVMKYHLRRTIGSALLSADELATVLAEIESVINNRPLIAVSEDFSDAEYLTPAHFLLGKKGGCLTDSLVYLDIPTKPQLVRRWKYRGQLMNRFWKQWRHDYLLQLRTAHTVKRASRNQQPLQLNDVVLIMEEKLPRGRWRLAKVIELTQGRDGKIRSAMLQDSEGTLLRRAVQHICPLEIA